jgi:26S proteasome regulatory subunit N8
MADTLIRVVEAKPFNMVSVHPTVLLSIVDHYNRVAKDTKKRVVGILLGFYGDKGVLDVTNCYAVPFEEDLQEPEIWFFDQIYHEKMFNMMRRINGKEQVIGWYSTGPTVKLADIQINEIVRRYNSNPCFVVVNVQDENLIGLPTSAYYSQEEVDDEGNLNRQFVHVSSSIGATEAEEIGVEHLLRDIKDASQGELSKKVSDKLLGLKVLVNKLKEMKDYLEKVVEGKYRYNQAIINNYQDIFNLLPNLKVEEMVRNFSVKSNDYMYVIYVSSLIRSILSLHDLINNKIHLKESEAEALKKAKEREDELQKKKEADAVKKVEEALKKAEDKK